MILKTELLGLGALITAAAAPVQAQDFYAGRQVNMLIGSGTGGGYDTYARLFIRHWPKYIPGNPTIVPQNLPAAGSLVAMNTLANSSPRDGSTIGAVQNHIGVEPFMGVTGPVENAKYDGRQMNWLGSASKEYPLVVVTDSSKITDFRQLLEKPVIVGSSGVATSDTVYARILNDFVGTKFKIIDGYKDQPQLALAMEQGEISGRAGWFLSSVMTTQSTQLEQGKLRILAQVAVDKHPDLPNVPLVTDFIDSPDKRAKLEFSLAWLPMGRPYVAPPGVPADRVKLLRDSFMQAAKDPELLAEARKMKLEISPLSGEEIQALMTRLYATPKDVVDSVRSIMVAK
ncbi:tripartite tricarboxylate transporter substrate-binding protein [Roseiarcaceae bacterium H3SJ34-1]|uniref:Bug family tripartite tricarboxylate transporter substrate binding protein n=1 Tax=Terripilifer ovatus TaxID=3032367 RepID=UPI003AB92118|nr:tripartite tricarboxylate transporter substrate-binding protein [Roseiarcaceae bacterium H3SJ34-1]